MKKQILRFIICLLVGFSWVTKTIAQIVHQPVSFANSTTVISESDSSQSTQLQHVPKGQMALSIGVGMLLGPMLGGAIGAFVPAETSEDTWINIFNGAVLGLHITPILNYELMLITKKIAQPKNRWAISVGQNQANSNHEATQAQTSYFLEILRRYSLYKALFFTSSLQYNQRKFKIENQKIMYSSMVRRQMWDADILFGEDYIDVMFAPGFQIPILHQAQVLISSGFSVAVPIYKRTQYKISNRIDESWSNPFNSEYNLSYDGENLWEAIPFYSWVVAVDLGIESLMLRATYKAATEYSHQIYGLNNETKISTIEFSVGCFLN